MCELWCLASRVVIVACNAGSSSRVWPRTWVARAASEWPARGVVQGAAVALACPHAPITAHASAQVTFTHILGRADGRDAFFYIYRLAGTCLDYKVTGGVPAR